MPPLVKKNCPTENSILKQTLITSDEFELVFSSSSRAMKVPSQAELRHFNFRAETELTILTICMSKNSKF